MGHVASRATFEWRTRCLTNLLERRAGVELRERQHAVREAEHSELGDDDVRSGKSCNRIGACDLGRPERRDDDLASHAAVDGKHLAGDVAREV